MASTKAATMQGVFLRPGVSKNNRLYTRENIATAVTAMQGMLGTVEGLPLSMATSHAAAYSDDALSRIGRVTAVEQLSDGSATFTAEIANTTQGRDIAILGAGKFIRPVSIRGAWGSDPVTVEHEGKKVSTSDSLSVIGIDFTNSPGVEGAGITSVTLEEAYVKDDPTRIFESVDDVEILEVEPEVFEDEKDNATLIAEAVAGALRTIEEKDKAPYGDVTYADPGYRDGVRRYPINTESHVRAAWSYINMPKNQKGYTPAQVARIKGRIKSAAKKFGIDIAGESAAIEAEIYEAISARYSGEGTEMEESVLKSAAQKATLAVQEALYELGGDTDMDGDLPSAEPDNDDDDNCTGCGLPLVDGAFYCPTCGLEVTKAESNDAASTQTTEEIPVSEDITPTADATATKETEAQAPATLSMTPDQFTAAVGEAVAAAMAAKEADAAAAREAAEAEAAKVAEAAEAIVAARDAEAAAAAEAAAPAEAATPDDKEPEVAESMTPEAVAEAIKTAVEAALETARADESAAYRLRPTRKGLTGSAAVSALLSESEPDAKRLSELSSEEFMSYQGEIWGNTNFFGNKFAAADAASASL